MEKGEAKDPRLKLFFGSLKYTDLTNRDEGFFSVSFDGRYRQDIIKLRILDCAEKITQYYYDLFTIQVPRHVDILEFTPLHSVDLPKVLWNRTDPQTNKGGRGRMKRNSWEIKHITQKSDMGHYNLREADNTLVSRILLEVKAHKRYLDGKVNEHLFIPNPQSTNRWTVIFRPEDDVDTDIQVTDYDSPFEGRVRIRGNGITIDPVEITDTGIFEFRDPEGNVAQTVQVAVENETVTTLVYVGIGAGIIFAVIVCCCCVRKCCCKKSSSKRDESAPQSAAAPAVYYHDRNQPAGPSYSAAPAPHFSYQPVNSSVCNPVNIHVIPPQPEVAPLGGQGADPPAPSGGSDWLSSDHVPTFEKDGILSANPLSSDTHLCNVYTSDKLNFM